ncbi:hypothetical protein [Bombilactobacillus thymidiniphilus]|uniref:Lipoprotein n=1 Tax=Bombilactobacillus thymidiniphilus TaxID=2923363 RepID=A0ABY4PBX5_9LACO|nr:hypothetical protein [Bombilactobacillus thymidiniphilus]UQS83041.1 hypothetical protein MOO47_04455 [Bombilactobacillus thymidiniphilus]
MKKKLIAIVVSFFALFVLVGCGKAKQAADQPPKLSMNDLKNKLNYMEDQYYPALLSTTKVKSIDDVQNSIKKMDKSEKNINKTIKVVKKSKADSDTKKKVIQYGHKANKSLNVLSTAFKKALKGKDFDDSKASKDNFYAAEQAAELETSLHKKHSWHEAQSKKKFTKQATQLLEKSMDDSDSNTDQNNDSDAD